MPAAAEEVSADLFGGTGIGLSLLPDQRRFYTVGVGTDVVTGIQAVTRTATDAGSLLGKSPATRGLNVQRRNPVISDPRIRGSRVGSLAASGSYWVPARIDLDTVLSKIDSRLLSDVIAVKGPYAARYGPGLSHLDVDLLASPRYEGGFQVHGLTGADYKHNGEGWYGRQMLWGGSNDWGFRAAYGHRTGNDYTSGSGVGVPSSYNSRDANIALGGDLTETQSVEFNYLRMDQTNVELPGQAFDIDFLVTDGYDVTYVAADHDWFDQQELNVWYNRTRFEGSAQNAGKRRQFPYYDFVNFVGNTDVDSMSTGGRLATTWGEPECEHFTAGADLRYLKQELNEITSGRVGFNIWRDANSPIPESYQINPGLYCEYSAPMGECWTFEAGARADLIVAEVTEDPSQLASLGTQSKPYAPISLADILGTSDFDQTWGLWAGYASAQYELNSVSTLEFAAGFAERFPALTELYAAETFMFVLQNGLNTVTGDPRLDSERGLQIDLGWRLDTGRFRGRIGGFHSWVWDYITFENMGIVRGPPAGQVEQVQLKYVNTDLATFVGGELSGEYDWSDWLMPFANLSYVDGRDRTRNGTFATSQAEPGQPSQRWPGLPRGAFSGISGGEQEPLPGISPLESRLGFRLHQCGASPRWSVELSARLANRQDRVATSLLESTTPGFTVWDLRSYWRATDRWLLIAGVENFTDRNYREHLDFRSQSGIQMYQPGINFYFGSEVTY
jgi:iron complex outermembrane recepter protein